MTSIPKSAAAEVRVELDRLSSLLEANLRGYEEAEKLELDDAGAPGLVELWSTIAWSPSFAEAGLELPTHEHARAYAKATLADYRSWGEGMNLTLRSLPKVFRVVEGDSSGVGFAFADETGRPYDPPLKMVSTDEQAVIDLYDSSIRWTINILMPLAFASWYQTSLGLEPMPELDEQPFKWISPATRRIDDQLWSLPPSPDAEAPAPEGTTYAHKTVKRLVTWLFELPDLEAIDLSVPPGKELKLGAKAKEIDAKKWAKIDNLRVLQHPEEADFSYRVGTIAGKPAIISIAPYLTTLAFEPRDRKFFEALVDERGWIKKAGRRS